jgi:hypothetical protein
VRRQRQRVSVARSRTDLMLRAVVGECDVRGRDRRACLAFAHAYDRRLRRSVTGLRPPGTRRLIARFCGMGLAPEILWQICRAIEARRTGLTAC